MGYLSKQALSGLKHYAYKPGGYTILDNWHQPFWNYTVELLPMWLAPNLVTLMGLAAVFAATLTGWYYDPDLLQESPRWVFGLMAFAQFFYLHVDCLDGKQARRTGSSSPLGQLFDHGCDTLVIQFVLATLVTSMDVPPSWMLTLGTLVICTPFIMAHWEEYHTGTMVYGNGLWGVTEANYAVVLLHFVSFVFGTGFWTAAPLAALAPAAAAWLRARGLPAPPALERFLATLPTHGIALLGLAFMGSLMMSEQVMRVFLPSEQQRLEREAHRRERGDHRTVGRRVAVAHAAQILAFIAAGAALVHAPAERAGPARLRLAAFGTGYALQTTRLIMAHMAKVPFRISLWPLAALALQIANAYAPEPFAAPGPLCAAVTAVIVAGYLHYVVSVIREICAYLGIRALTIDPKPPAKKHDE